MLEIPKTCLINFQKYQGCFGNSRKSENQGNLENPEHLENVDNQGNPENP